MQQGPAVPAEPQAPAAPLHAAAEAWRRWFVGDALAPGAGEAARDGLLKHGGAVAPDTLLRNVLGEDGLRKDHASGGIAPNPNAALAELGVR